LKLKVTCDGGEGWAVLASQRLALIVLRAAPLQDRTHLRNRRSRSYSRGASIR